MSPTEDAKRKKLQGACDTCYKRKVRCDSAEKPDHKCSNCITAKIACTHDRAKFRNTPLDLKTGQQHVAEILSTSAVYIPTKDPVLGHHILVQVARYARELEEIVVSLTAQQLPIADTSNLGASEWEDTTSPATAGILSNAYFNTLTISDDTSDDSASSASQNCELYHGKSSMVQFVRSVLKGMNGDNVIYAFQRPEFWMTPPWEKLVLSPARLFFPDDDLLHTLIQIYFAQVNPIFCILHSRTFQESVAAGLHFRDHKFGRVVLAVCAIGSRYSDDPRVLVEGETSEHSCGWKWFRQVRTLQMPVSPEPSLHELQLIALSILYLSGFTQSEECWLLASLGVRLAQASGAHLRAEKSQKLDPLHRELHKRVFWILVVSDILTSSFKGRPKMTSEADMDTDLPVDVADEYWGVPPSHRSTGTPSNGTFFVAFLKLLRIYGKIQHEIYPADRTMCDQDRVFELDSELNSWADSVPDHLRWDPNQENQIYLDQSAAIYAIYYHAQMLIHRPFIPIPGKPPINTNFPSLAICANAARACGHVLDVQARRGRGLLHHPHVMSALFEAAIVLLINVWGTNGSKPRAAETVARAVADVQNFVNVLRLYERRWRVAGIRSDILSALLNHNSARPISCHCPDTTQAVSDARDSEVPSHSSSLLSQQRQELELSAQEPSHLFALPVHTEELGSLPIYDSFEYAFDETLRASMGDVAMDSGAYGAYGASEAIGMPPVRPMDPGLDIDPNFLVHTSFDLDVPSNFGWQDWGGYAQGT